MDIILASASPRRSELLKNIGLRSFRIIPAQGEERVEAGESPENAVCALSRAKALEVAARCGADNIIIAADTLVSIDGEILGKPKDEDEATSMLKKLSGRVHEVYTGVTLVKGGAVLTEFERSVVRFRSLSDREIRAYVATGEPMDKAGAYGAQGLGALLVEGINGDFFNVMGLPLCRLSKMLSELGVTLL